MAKKNKSAQVDDIIVRLKKRNKPKKAKGGTYRDYAESVRGKATVNQRQPTKAEIEESLKKGKESATADFKAAEARAKKDGRSVYGKDPEGNYYVNANIRKAHKRSISGAVEPGMTPMDLLGGGASLAGILGLGGKAALKAAAKGSLKEVASKASKEAGMGSARKAAVEAARKLMQKTKGQQKRLKTHGEKVKQPIRRGFEKSIEDLKNFPKELAKKRRVQESEHVDFMNSMQKKYMGKNNWREMRGPRDYKKSQEHRNLQGRVRFADLDSTLYPGAPKKIIEAMHFGAKNPKFAKSSLKQRRKTFEEIVGTKFRDYMDDISKGRSVEKYSDGIKKFMDMAID